MLTIKKSTFRKTGAGGAILLLLVLLIMLLTPGQVSLAEGDTCGDGVCSASENSDLCGADCGCVDNGVADPGEGYGCKDVVGPDEYLSSACGTPATTQDADGNWLCPSGMSQYHGEERTLSEFNGYCWDACECEGQCTETAEEEGSAGGGASMVCSVWTLCGGASQSDCPTVDECKSTCGDGYGYTNEQAEGLWWYYCGN